MDGLWRDMESWIGRLDGWIDGSVVEKQSDRQTDGSYAVKQIDREIDS